MRTPSGFSAGRAVSTTGCVGGPSDRPLHARLSPKNLLHGRPESQKRPRCFRWPQGIISRRISSAGTEHLHPSPTRQKLLPWTPTTYLTSAVLVVFMARQPRKLSFPELLNIHRTKVTTLAAVDQDAARFLGAIRTFHVLARFSPPSYRNATSRSMSRLPSVLVFRFSTPIREKGIVPRPESLPPGPLL